MQGMGQNELRIRERGYRDKSQSIIMFSSSLFIFGEDNKDRHGERKNPFVKRTSTKTKHCFCFCSKSLFFPCKGLWFLSFFYYFFFAFVFSIYRISVVTVLIHSVFCILYLWGLEYWRILIIWAQGLRNGDRVNYWDFFLII